MTSLPPFYWPLKPYFSESHSSLKWIVSNLGTSNFSLFQKSAGSIGLNPEKLQIYNQFVQVILMFFANRGAQKNSFHEHQKVFSWESLFCYNGLRIWTEIQKSENQWPWRSSKSGPHLWSQDSCHFLPLYDRFIILLVIRDCEGYRAELSAFEVSTALFSRGFSLGSLRPCWPDM